MKKQKLKKMTIAKETLRQLDEEHLEEAAGGAISPATRMRSCAVTCQDSVNVCCT
jgi:hypothetical protein